FALDGPLVHVRDLDPVDHAGPSPRRERAARLIGVDVNLQRFGIYYDEQRIAELLELVLDPVAVEIVALDHEGRAVAVGRELLVNGLDVELLAFRRRFGQGLAGRRGSKTTHDFEQARAPCVDNSSLPQHLEPLRRPRDGLFPTPDESG